MFEERVDLSNNVTWRQMIGVGGRNVVLARGELDRLEGPGYAARRAELRRKAKEAERTRERQAAAAAQNEAEESDATEEEATRESTTRRGRPRGGTKVAARIGERLRREIDTRIMWVNEKSSAQFVYVRLSEWLGGPQASPREPLRCHISSLVIVET